MIEHTQEKELTLEEAKAKIAELEAKVPQKPKELTPKEREEREKQIKTFYELRRGAGFIKFILDDLNRVTSNRNQRRRLTREMFNKKFSQELVDRYTEKIDDVLNYLNAQVVPESLQAKIQTHYQTFGYESPEILRELLKDAFKEDFLLKGEVKSEPADGADFYNKLKTEEQKGE